MNIKDFFYIRKGDRSAILILLAVAVVSLALIFALGGKNSSDPEAVPFMSGRHPSADSTQSSKPQYYAVDGQKAERFAFDPNTADSTQLLRLGLQPWQVRNIYRYRAKGGVFRVKTDFARVYGLTAGQYKELEPYIQISPDYRPAAEVYGDRRPAGGPGYGHAPSDRGMQEKERREREDYPRDTLRYPVKLKAGEHIDVNRADTTQLKKIPGIGSYYARSVVRYRERLGGFYSAEQLLEIEGFPVEALEYVSVSAGMVRKLNLNRLSVAELRRHPYVNFYQAKAIEGRPPQSRRPVVAAGVSPASAGAPCPLCHLLTACLQILLDGVDELLVFLVGEIYLARVHLEGAAVVGTVDIFRSQVEVQMAQFVAVGAIVTCATSAMKALRSSSVSSLRSFTCPL